jgi:hypothetical protein
VDATPTYISVDTMEAGPELDALVAEWVMGWHNGTAIIPVDQWHPSTDISAAMILADKWEGALDMTRARSGNWSVRLMDGEVVAMAYARTLPLAICRAALKAVLPVPEVVYSEDDED